MPKYRVHVGFDVPAYGSDFIEAANPAEALTKAVAIADSLALEPAWDGAENGRIVGLDEVSAQGDAVVTHFEDLPLADPDAAPPVVQVCAICGGTNVKVDAWAAFNHATQRWELAETFDDAHCDDCGGETRVVAKPLASAGAGAG